MAALANTRMVDAQELAGGWVGGWVGGCQWAGGFVCAGCSGQHSHPSPPPRSPPPKHTHPSTPARFARPAELLVKQQEAAEWQMRVQSVHSGDLPAYIEVRVCVRLSAGGRRWVAGGWAGGCTHPIGGWERRRGCSLAPRSPAPLRTPPSHQHAPCAAQQCHVEMGQLARRLRELEEEVRCARCAGCGRAMRSVAHILSQPLGTRVSRCPACNSPLPAPHPPTQPTHPPTGAHPSTHLSPLVARWVGRSARSPGVTRRQPPGSACCRPSAARPVGGRVGGWVGGCSWVGGWVQVGRWAGGRVDVWVGVWAGGRAGCRRLARPVADKPTFTPRPPPPPPRPHRL